MMNVKKGTSAHLSKPGNPWKTYFRRILIPKKVKLTIQSHYASTLQRSWIPWKIGRKWSQTFGFISIHLVLDQYVTCTIWNGPIDIKFGVNVNSDKWYVGQCPYKLKTIFWTKFLTPERLQFCGQYQITSIVKTIEWNQNVWHQTNCISRMYVCMCILI